MERHVHSSQDFVPLDCAAYLVLVALRGTGGHPDEPRLRAFRVPGDAGIHHHAGTWHHPLTALDRPASFAVLTFVDGTTGDIGAAVPVQLERQSRHTGSGKGQASYASLPPKATKRTRATKSRASAARCMHQVNVRIEDADGAINIVSIHDALPKLHLDGLDLGGDLCFLADQADDQVIISHGLIFRTKTEWHLLTCSGSSYMMPLRRAAR